LASSRSGAAVLYRRAHLPGRPGLSALLVRGGRIAWIGPDAEAEAGSPSGAETVDLDGALVLPGFVDAHVHVTETGLLLAGVDLSATRSVIEILDLVAAAARRRPGRPVLGHGWDELRLAEGRAPTLAELDRAAAGTEVYLSRVDVHSAVVSGALATRAGLAALTGWDASGRIERDAHHAARHATRFALKPPDRTMLQRLALEAAAACGITELHEMSAPHVAPEEDLPSLLDLTATSDPPLPAVVPYRGELAETEEDVHRITAEVCPDSPAGDGPAGEYGQKRPALAGLAGDLMVDGSFGSRTAALRHDYADLPGHRGHLYLTVEQIRDHVVSCTRAGVQAGFHVIGDAAVDAALAGFEAAAAILGDPAIRAAGHRVEHLEAVDPAGVSAVARLGLIASVQPAFDAAWGGAEAMYAIRLGTDRALALNPFATMSAAGVPLAFGSDSPVTPFSPWEAIRAALRHRTPTQRIDVFTALAAHLDGGRRAAGPTWRRSSPGVVATVGPELAGDAALLKIGAAATFTCWRSPGLVAASGAGASAARLFDPLTAVGEELSGGDAPPACVLTVMDGAASGSIGVAADV
jgi:predicted amidohydrolase YtcJ